MRARAARMCVCVSVCLCTHRWQRHFVVEELNGRFGRRSGLVREERTACVCVQRTPRHSHIHSHSHPHIQQYTHTSMHAAPTRPK